MDAEWVVDWPRLTALRDRWRRRDPANGMPARVAVRAHANLAAFVDFVAGEWAGGEPPCEPAVAMAFFGPAGAPPAELWDAFAAIHRRLAAAADDPQAVDGAHARHRADGGLRRELEAERADGGGVVSSFDLMLAFGCGWGRAVVGGERWWGRWEVAYATMINQVRASLVATNRLLVDQFPQFQLSPDDLLEYPGDFTVSLLVACDCGHHVRECRRDCGRECCFASHALAAWDPLECHLRPFIDQAVRGTAVRTILAGAFAESLTFRALEREGRILRRRVEFTSCPHCEQLYEEETCPQPGCDAPEGRALRRVARANWLILPSHERGGNYREMTRWVCGGCKNIYPMRFRLRDPVADDPCPVCAWRPAPAARPSKVTVWVRLPSPPPLGQRRAEGGLAAVDDPYDAQGEEGTTDDE